MPHKPIRVLHIINTLSYGGAEILLREGLRVADRSEVELHFASLNDKNDLLRPDLADLGGTVTCLGLDHPRYFFRAFRRGLAYIRTRDIDIIHAHLPVSGFMARLLGRVSGRPVLYTEHSLPAAYSRPMQLISRISWGWQQYVTAISEDVEAGIHQRYGNKVPVQVICNSINTARIAPHPEAGARIRAQYGIPPEARVAGTIASLRNSPAKRMDVWLQAAQKIAEKEPSARFMIVGDGDRRPALEALAASLGLQDRVVFTGNQADVVPFLNAFDVFLLSSQYEGFGIVLIEAMACGIPVSATQVAGIRNIITPNETGLLAAFDESVAASLAQNTLRLFREPALARRLSNNGRQRVEQQYSIQNMQRSFEDIYRKLLHD
ncbi:Glycosyltransferase involved in cell wall bisynthesis [Cyclonatronum proteinivorum]|uniref:Glycosyltransferase involved in cell wall bisynthesis n=1 Tax=Cyclonatronum proteinivorum TaxID=1457365 RepID=A0A345UMM4_9BACT|nr:glycosyltransferase [Cyclonatronum proteinivorum]AXJ01726.1 Glycosyltransferase involved in cell wall bisynthesis [Cyclonatronum proteinivorum]